MRHVRKRAKILVLMPCVAGGGGEIKGDEVRSDDKVLSPDMRAINEANAQPKSILRGLRP